MPGDRESGRTNKQQRQQLNPTTRAQINILGRLDGWTGEAGRPVVPVEPGEPSDPGGPGKVKGEN